MAAVAACLKVGLDLGEIQAGLESFPGLAHRMEQVEKLCDDICLFAKGRIVLQGPLREVKQRYGRGTVQLDFDGDASFLDALVAEGAVRLSDRSHTHAEVHLLDGTPPRRILDAALGSVDELYRFEITELPLNEIFVRAVGESRNAEVETRK